MSPRVRLSRLKLLALAACAFSALGNPAAGQSAAPPDAGPGPRFRADGPDADARGRAEGYPICTRANWFMDKWCLVGALSGFDQLYPVRIIVAPKASARLGRAPSEPGIGYAFAGQNLTLDQYLDKHPVTGFLLAKDDTILIERYQYARTGSHRLASFSMAKTIVALLIGIAAKEGAIRSIEDLAEVYVPGLRGTEYGLTPIKALLQMSSGVLFRDRNTPTLSAISRYSLG